MRTDVPYASDSSRVYFGTDTHSIGLVPGLGRRRVERAAFAAAPVEPVRASSGSPTCWPSLALALLGWEFLHLDEFRPALYRGGFVLLDTLAPSSSSAPSIRPGSACRVGARPWPSALDWAAFVRDLPVALAGRRRYPAGHRRPRPAAARQHRPGRADPGAGRAQLPLRREPDSLPRLEPAAEAGSVPADLALAGRRDRRLHRRALAGRRTRPDPGRTAAGAERSPRRPPLRHLDRPPSIAASSTPAGATSAAPAVATVAPAAPAPPPAAAVPPPSPVVGPERVR